MTVNYREVEHTVEFDPIDGWVYRVVDTEIECQVEEAYEESLRATEKFEVRVAAVIDAGAADRETAVRWIADADGCNGDLEHLCYVNGLPLTYFDKEVS